MQVREKDFGNKFLSHIREVDSIIEVVRCFEDSNITHVDGNIDPIRDIETINVELVLADIETVDKKIERATKMLKGDKKYKAELDVLEKIKNVLNEGKPARTISFSEEEKELLKETFLLTLKPILYVTNVSEQDITNIENNIYVKNVQEHAKKENAETVILSAKIEEELTVLNEEDKKEMLKELGLNESGLDKLVKASYKLLGLISFLTAGEPEVRAWTIKNGTKAPGAAGAIHTDFERGFIKAEVISYDELITIGSIVKAKEKGMVRFEGKEYVVKDGDVILFKFNV